MFNSYDKDMFVVGKEYYTYHMDCTFNSNALKDYTGIMKVKVTSNVSNDSSGYLFGVVRYYTEFEILESKKLSKTIAHNIHLYMNGYGIATTNFFDTYEECVVQHDKDLISRTKGKTTADKERILNKLINKVSKPGKPKIETDSIDWYKKLSKKEQKYVQWIKEYWDEI